MENQQLQYQHTLKGEITLSGIGLHTGAYVNMTLKPATPGHGIKFQRVDLPGQPIVKADVDYVVETTRSTTLEHNGARVSTVEHIMAALAGTGVDNVLVELDGGEIPIMDGSAYAFIEAIEKTGLQNQDAKKVYYTIDTNISYYDEKKKVEMVAMPALDYRITCLIDFNSPVLGTQHAKMKGIEEFKTEIAPCRTFCFLHELEYQLSLNLIKGGDINNAIVVVDKPVTEDELTRLAKVFNRETISVQKEGILNNIELRFPNEPARHKLLDVVGDLALIGYPINAHIIANRPGHASNVEFARAIKAYIKKNKHNKDVPVYDPNQPPVFDTPRIERTLPHRYPMLLVDKIIELGEEKVVGIKNVTFNEHFFQGHFPSNPVMPGVLQLEALAQVGGILALNRVPDPENYDTYFLKIDNCKFKQKVVPGDTMILKMELLSPIRRGLVEMRGTVFIGNKVATEADMIAQIIKTREGK
ncbi:3-hydroxyacyl-[acyl-carrier-protein] dehydratase /UDP-3-O-[3-hydroxymyristoyl] N-acetylglucosamine deacetylase [Chitinophaga ginsengisegetis]|uniref:Multifunctional fusion protein n=1 Tax=Chitinophaga ginsengisegetis TaxID=393003 RepID=A0A1T5PCB9_9BACT|nr:bifunctional UDP-3-O-[3-hydroxymyristoyl] N-acetylglucosamine deacetylase/3-hydroxyacyl-ACP dehydratase [Chitinophaga ginsengisegetis]MDR6570222.1 UDP-3-O-[3-hydroxymyristoyl] N-acetylglucosamine deacetylase/3-hydroxyacyl-[acyl-carrier-protein] dehydratase [Chitinophaga ginsengisegetis]MDR6649956.1 UDP-3-O-[3-hydroxymyristoyl] N-acetylglucosamine deacetylase/3-hydroxyacyl-[acyl-carrier-protein] dehydratase [Chitinophaga ginsengisegetis]MDR6656403.1 UDP-3-O-[3-hydroxymyristoyl] N-acetylglucosa